MIHLYITTYRINVLTHFIHRSKSFLVVVVDNSGIEAIVVQFTFFTAKVAMENFLDFLLGMTMTSMRKKKKTTLKM